VRAGGTEGDSFVLAFHAAKDAVAFTLAAQEALLHVDWPAGAAAACLP
jgi:hypothetical protein